MDGQCTPRAQVERLVARTVPLGGLMRDLEGAGWSCDTYVWVACRDRHCAHYDSILYVQQHRFALFTSIQFPVPSSPPPESRRQAGASTWWHPPPHPCSDLPIFETRAQLGMCDCRTRRR